MKRRFKRANAVILILCLFVSIIGGINIKPASAMTTQSAAVNWIRSQNGKAIDMDGSYGAQCVDLIAAYFEYLGVSWRSMTVNYAKDYAWRSLPGGWQRIQGGAIQPGDIVIWTGGKTGHVALAISGNRVVEQNYNSIKKCVENPMHWNNYWGVIRPNFNAETPPAAGAVPQGCVDGAEGGVNKVHLTGWVFDRDALSQPVEIHVYIGGPAGVGEGHGGIIANVYGPDVDKVYPGIGSYHRFDTTIRTSHSGMQDIYVYAINIGGGDNPQIGKITADISQDTTAPAISNVRVTDLNSEGYTVTCRVEDAEGIAKVQFPTWTAANDQDDLAENWQDDPSCSGTQDGTTWSFRVNDKDHNFERGVYHTHIYAYDNNGNVACYDVNNIVLQNTYSHVNTAVYNGHTYHLYNDILTWEEAKKKCEELGGHLVTITSAGEQEMAAGLIQGQARRGYWIGGSSDNGSSWVNGEEFSFHNWEPGEPNADGGEDCYGIYTDKGTWNDWLGSNRSLGLGFICEWDEEKVEKPDHSSDMDNPAGNGSGEPKETENPTATTDPMEKPGETELPGMAQKPTASPEPTATPAITQKPAATTDPIEKPGETELPGITQKPTASPDPTATPAVTQKPAATTDPMEKPGETELPGITQKPTASPDPTATPAVTQKPAATTNPMEKPGETELPGMAQKPTASPEPTATPAITHNLTAIPVPMSTSKPIVAKKLKIFSVKCKRKTKKITGKVSASNVSIKIKIGQKAYKKATVKGKRFELKSKNKLLKGSKITIKVTKKNYKSLIKSFIVK